MYETVPMHYRGQLPGIRMYAQGRPGGLAGPKLGTWPPARGRLARGGRVPVVLRTPYGYLTDFAPAPPGPPVEFVGMDIPGGIPAAIVVAGIPRNPVVRATVPTVMRYTLPYRSIGMNGIGDFITVETIDGDGALMNASESGVPLESLPVAMSTSSTGLSGPFDAILNALGLRDPIAHYEPELQYNLPRLFGKYEDLVSRYLVEVGGLRSNSERARLADVLGHLARLVEDIRPAFTSGGVTGKRERDKLAELVQGVRDFQTDWRNAKKAYGWGPAGPDPETPAAPAPTYTPMAVPMVPPAAMGLPEGVPWGLLILGGVAIALGAVVLKRGRRRSA